MEEAFLTEKRKEDAEKLTWLNSELEKALSRAEATEAKVIDAEVEMEGVAEKALYMAWCTNRSMDLSFMEEHSLLARFETKLVVEESTENQA